MKIDYDLATPSWEDSHRYGPAPRWRRRILRNMIGKLNNVSTACDVGCAQPFLMLEMKKLGLKVSGCDISKPVIEKNAKFYPDMDFFLYDLDKGEELEKSGRGGVSQYDIVTCSEVLEHLEHYERAVRNICQLSSRYILITVPSGKRYPIDEGVGHIRHYEPGMLTKPLEENGFKVVKAMKVGFPFHSLYKRLINLGGGSGIADKYSSNTYGWVEKLISNCVYFSFYFNIFPFGSQLIILAEKQ